MSIFKDKTPTWTTLASGHDHRPAEAIIASRSPEVRAAIAAHCSRAALQASAEVIPQSELLEPQAKK